MASDLTNIIKDDICNTLESLLANSVTVTSTSSISKNDFSDAECIKVMVEFNFSVIGETKWNFYIPTKTATKFEYLMLGGISDEKDAIDDEISDAVNEIVSNISGSIVTNINAQGFEDLGTTKFKNLGKDTVGCSEDKAFDKMYQFNLSISDSELLIYLELDDVILPFFSELVSGYVSTEDTQQSSSGEETLMHPILSLLGEESIDNLKLLLDIKFKLSVRLGTKTLLLKDVLTWDTGSIIELSQMVNEPLDILVNDVKIGEGEAVIVDNRFGIKIKSIGIKNIT